MTGPTPEQRRFALNHANENRLSLAKARQEIRAGERSLADLVENPEPWFNCLTYDAMLMLPLFGKHKLRAFNAHAMYAHVNIAAPVTELSPGSRAWLVAWLRNYEEAREQYRMKKQRRLLHA